MKRKDVYIKTTGKGKIVKTESFGMNGGSLVLLDFNKKEQVVGVEIIDASEIKINGKKV